MARSLIERCTTGGKKRSKSGRLHRNVRIVGGESGGKLRIEGKNVMTRRGGGGKFRCNKHHTEKKTTNKNHQFGGVYPDTSRDQWPTAGSKVPKKNRSAEPTKPPIIGFRSMEPVGRERAGNGPELVLSWISPFAPQVMKKKAGAR